MFYKKIGLTVTTLVKYFKKLPKPRTVYYFFNARKKIEISYFLRSGLQDRNPDFFFLR